MIQVHEVPSADEQLEHLAHLLLKNGEIVSDQRPFKLTTKSVKEVFNDNYAEQLSEILLIDSWLDEEGESEVKFLELALELTVDAAKDLISSCIPVEFYHTWDKPN